MEFLQSIVDAVKLPGGWVLAVQIFLIVFLALAFDYTQRRLTKRLRDKVKDSKNLWDDAFFDALRRPLSLFIWVVGISYAAELIQQETQAPIFSAIPAIRDVAVISCFAWFLLRLITGVEQNFIKRATEAGEEVDPTTSDAVGKLLRASVVITAVLVALQTLGFSISGVLAFGGVGGIAVGFAARDLLANFFGGLTVYLDRPFKVGDWIRSPDRNIEGVVENIGWRTTRIRTFDKRPLYVPNAIFTTIVVENPSRMTNRRIYETIGLRYDDFRQVSNILQDVRQYLRNDKDIDQSRTLMVNFNEYSASSLDFFIYTFT
ncbi:MAG: mechanosensitive ion channel family protein, partial [Gammaproteobacteria bacterium]|nr:mechanosensitive ion channel family protein [Gammaproteobacteria bacterium]